MKRDVDELAVFGGEPSFAEPLHVGRPNIGREDRFLDRVRDILDRRWLTNHGVYVSEFEKRIEDYIGVEHCIAVCNATTGLQLVARALALTGEIIMPSFTFIATPHSMQWLGLKPVFCDVDHDTQTIDPAAAAQLITSRTSAIVGVHVWGRPCGITALEDIAGEHGLKLLFDAAHAFGCARGKQMIGSFGDAEVFSFHATKFLNTFEGGAVVTNNEGLAQELRLRRNFGFAGLDTVIGEGVNAKMHEVSAAMGVSLLDCIDDLIETNRGNFAAYGESLEGVPGLTLLPVAKYGRSNYQYVVLEVDASASGLSRDDLLLALRLEGVLARRYFYPGCHRMEPYRSLYAEEHAQMPVTEQLVESVLQLPTGTAVSHSDIDTICQLLRLMVNNADAVRHGIRRHAPLCTAPLSM